ncbi:50S ribosomal protein L18 [Rickettsia endosymbiont of Cardiosporidium cionae]|uniref:50S ribosomal protein L18 n=1 Tax=Rickettsia endosymbiont of Cardiosporidium cionae TaxID=2777155 RepID=UPI001895AFA7|nr:50S ribosomal protein L18 [Rickettsia endosymbiont of Cardiosporidium cionae]KAF8818186.1 50S ribosomal protein L18 [Rickettsia endosymbiont of Cardiosporidium cionae]
MLKSKIGFNRRKYRVRDKIKSITKRDRLSIFKSSRHLYAQVIDQETSRVILSVSTNSKAIRSMYEKTNKNYSNIDCAVKLGELFISQAQTHSIKSVVFDKSGYRYHGVIKAFADTVRKALAF